VLGTALPCSAGQGAFRGGAIEPPGPRPDFTLRTAEGKPFRLSQQRGKVVALYFGYTLCPMSVHDPGPAGRRQDAARRGGGGPARRAGHGGPRAGHAQALRTYTTAFDPSFLGLTGSTEALGKVWKAYGVFSEKKRVAGSPLGYLVDHSATTYIVDAEGQLRLTLPFGTPTDTLFHDLRLLLKR